MFQLGSRKGAFRAEPLNISLTVVGFAGNLTRVGGEFRLQSSSTWFTCPRSFLLVVGLPWSLVTRAQDPVQKHHIPQLNHSASRNRYRVSKVINFLNKCDNDLAPTESWGDRSQNCFHDMRVVGNS